MDNLKESFQLFLESLPSNFTYSSLEDEELCQGEEETLKRVENNPLKNQGLLNGS